MKEIRRKVKIKNRKRESRLKKLKESLKKPNDSDTSLVYNSPTSIPSNILQDRSFAVLETIVYHIKENYNLSFHEIGILLGRDERTIWTCYHRVKGKKKISFKKFPGSIDIPISIIKNRSVSILESIVLYMKDTQSLSYHQIAILLNRNDRTIWTVYSRAKRKVSR